MKRAWSEEEAARDGEDGLQRAWTEKEVARRRGLTNRNDAGWTASETCLQMALIIMTMKGAQGLKLS